MDQNDLERLQPHRWECTGKGRSKYSLVETNIMMLVQMLVPVSGELARIKPAVHRLELGPREDVTFFLSIERSNGGVFRPEKIVQYTSNIMQTEGKKTARILEPRRYLKSATALIAK